MIPAGTDNPLIAVVERYYDRPDLLVRELLGAEPDEKQTELLMAAARGERRIAVRSGHGVGKTTVLAWLILWHALTRFPQKTAATAPTMPQLFDALAAETKTWFGRLPPAIRSLFDVKAEEIVLLSAPSESFVSFKTSRAEKPEAMAGVHSANVLLIADEASGVPDSVFEAAVGSMSSPKACQVLAGNPIRGTGRFYQAFHELSDMWYKIHISCVGHPRVDPDLVEEIRRTYGENSNPYRTRILGEFPTADDDTVIPRELMAAALFRDVKPILVKPIWGVDCARFGSDASALARRRGNTLMKAVETKRGLDTMQVAGWIKNEWDKTLPSERPSEILVDVIGIGAGTLDRLLELKLPARGINVSESPTIFDEQYLNLRAELWFKGREWLNKRDSSLAGDTLLGEELVTPRFTYTSNGKLQVESKPEMKKRGKQSPNSADAFLLTLASESVTASAGSSSRVGAGEPIRRGLKMV